MSTHSIKEALNSHRTNKSYSDKLKDPRWQRKRLEIFERDEFSCKLCGNNESTLHVHHISYSNNPWDTDNKLLLTVCEDCHSEEEERLKEWEIKLIKELRKAGFMSLGLASLSKIFKDTDRDWTFYEPAFSILKMVVDDDEIWKKMECEFFKRD
jgi:hypothetical protein